MPDRGAGDPHAVIFADCCYIHATRAVATEAGLTVWSSACLVTWKNDGMILKLNAAKGESHIPVVRARRIPMA